MFTTLGFLFSVVLLTLNTIVFRDLTGDKLLFIVLSFVAFAAISSTIGNCISIRFPKRMRFGKRLNVSGVAGLFVIPMVLVLAAPPVVATLVGYFTRSFFYQYLTLLGLALVAVGFYFLVLEFQGRSLAKREIEILDAVREPADE